MKPTNRGVTLVELTIVSALVAVLAVFAGRILTGGTRTTVRWTLSADAMEKTQVALTKIEFDLEEMTVVSSSTPRFLEFQLDSNRLPGYNPTGDFDADGLTNEFDVDDDADMIGVGGVPIPATDMNGNDLWDQDDDNDGNIDVQCRYYIDANQNLVRDFNYQESGWGNNVEILLDSISGSIFKYFGSVNQIPGPSADSNRDNIVTWQEIDQNPATGNSNGVIDTTAERLYINSISVHLVIDKNNDTLPDFTTELRIRPPLLMVNRRV